MLLLHEIAHAMCPREEHHGELFWVTAWTLYRQFGLPVRSVLKHEEEYRKGARDGYLATKPGRLSVSSEDRRSGDPVFAGGLSGS